jgi:hypothetical protein
MISFMARGRGKIRPVRVTYADGRTEIVGRKQFRERGWAAEESERRKYKKYLLSQRWRKERALAIKRAKCCECCETVHRLQVHHKTYERFEREWQQDLLVLCEKCHSIAERFVREKRMGRDCDGLRSLIGQLDRHELNTRS